MHTFLYNGLLAPWTLLRFLRFLMGALLLVQAYQLKEYWIMGVAAFFILMALLNRGCCGVAGTCAPNTLPHNNSNNDTTEQIHYEEIKK